MGSCEVRPVLCQTSHDGNYATFTLALLSPVLLEEVSSKHISSAERGRERVIWKHGSQPLSGTRGIVKSLIDKAVYLKDEQKSKHEG